ncbi:MAG: ROK family transcriptional regulator [Lachnospiraceae bacterium]|jgi:N-acetylglucosamine repressor|nr:ROK family transcriptional regulator [Lachnospiraceae bacterium]MCI9341501.1 ROK family transcriptional regulator [Lachnospiraceae bacterium]GFH91055.1 protein mlc [Lachnospiraceae bacterium]
MNLIEMKKANRCQVYQLVYQNRRISKTDIAEVLNISIPTVSQCVNELKQLGLIAEDGFFESTGGRKSVAIKCRDDIRIAIGVDIRKTVIYLVALNLYGDIISSSQQEILFRKDESYCAHVADYIVSFFEDLHISDDLLLGVGICVQGLVSQDGKYIVSGRMMDADGFSASDIGKYLPFPFNPVLKHDTELAASYALWKNPGIKDALFLMLNPNLGGAIILNGQLHKGKTQSSGLIAHMTLVPEGKYCYCGKQGCVESYCSVNALLEGFGEEMGTFFEKLRAGDAVHRERWKEYMGYLSRAIYNYQVLMNTDVLLSGEMALYLTEDDLERLMELTLERMGIMDKLPPIRVIGENDVAPGVALYFIVNFLKQYMPDTFQHPEYYD